MQYSPAEDKNRKQEQARRNCENQDEQPGETERLRVRKTEGKNTRALQLERGWIQTRTQLCTHFLL